MKKLYTLLVIALLSVPFSGSAKEVVKLTRYAGQTITGVSVSHMFTVELVKSQETKATVEIDKELESYLKLELKPEGTVSADLEIPKNEQRRLDKKMQKMTLKLTVYLPEVVYIELEDMVKLSSADTFSGENIRINLEDMAKINQLKLDVERVALKVEDMAAVSLAISGQRGDISVENMGKVNLKGQVEELNIVCENMGKVNADGLKTKRAEVKAADMAKVSVYVSQYLYARSTNMASITYKGDPQEIDLKTPQKSIRNSNR